MVCCARLYRRPNSACVASRAKYALRISSAISRVILVPLRV